MKWDSAAASRRTGWRQSRSGVGMMNVWMEASERGVEGIRQRSRHVRVERVERVVGVVVNATAHTATHGRMVVGVRVFGVERYRALG